jgi:diaminopimelate decarboxylase
MNPIEIPEEFLSIQGPFFVCSRSVLERQVEWLRSMGLEVFYSTKTNPELVILKELHSLGTGFSVSSPEELIKVMAMGAKAEEVYYYERGLNVERAAWLKESGCKKYIVETKTAYENILGVVDKGSSILFRLKSSKVGSNYEGSYNPGFEHSEIKKLLGDCKGRGIECGVLHHSSSQVEDPKMWRKKFELLSKLPEADIINIGGGLPISYKKNHEDVLKEVEKGVKKLNAKKIIAEPGRFIVGPSCSLVTKVMLADKDRAVLNASVYNTHIDTIIADIVLPSRTANEGKKKTYSLLGSSLCNLDIFDIKARLPELNEGDTVIFDYAGAYNFSSDFGSGSGIETYIVP